METPLSTLCQQSPYVKQLLGYVLCLAATSAPVESVFSQSGLFIASKPSKNVECFFKNACVSEVQHLTSLNLWFLLRVAAADLSPARANNCEDCGDLKFTNNY